MYQVGENVYVPNAYDFQWQPYLTTIEEIDGDTYYCRIRVYNLIGGCTDTLLANFRRDEIFATIEECQNHIDYYYYGKYCENCHYDDIAGDVWDCHDCSHLRKEPNPTFKYHDRYYCDRTRITVGGSYANCHEICAHYDPTLPQNKKSYVSWDFYDDILRNCTFNPDCDLHTKSVHKTCPYERYMNQYVSFPLLGVYDGKKTDYGLVTRKV